MESDKSIRSIIFTGAILGFNRNRPSSIPNKFVGRVIETSNTFMRASFQGETGSSDINLYDPVHFIYLPLTEDLLEATESFTKTDSGWMSKDSFIFISKNDENSVKKWNVEIFDIDHNVTTQANFDYIHELQSYCYTTGVELDIKLGTVIALYKDYIQNT
jgi:hypothetical protein